MILDTRCVKFGKMSVHQIKQRTIVWTLGSKTQWLCTALCGAHPHFVEVDVHFLLNCLRVMQIKGLTQNLWHSLVLYGHLCFYASSTQRESHWLKMYHLFKYMMMWGCLSWIYIVIGLNSQEKTKWPASKVFSPKSLIYGSQNYFSFCNLRKWVKMTKVHFF